MIPSVPAVLGLIQAIKVYGELPTGMLVAVGMLTYWLAPLKLKALPTSPVAVAVAPLTSVPPLVPMLSEALPSPFHQPTRPEEKDAFSGVAVLLPPASVICTAT